MRRWLLAGVLIGAAAAGSVYLAVDFAFAPGPLGQARDVVVPHGTSSRVGEALHNAGVIRSTAAFRLFAAGSSGRGPLRAAELRFPAKASLVEVLAILRTGKPVEHLLTIAEGLTAAQVGEVFMHEEALSGEFVLPAEGSVLPQSYAFERGASRMAVLRRAQEAMTAALKQSRGGAASPDDRAAVQSTVILASMVERETAVAAERPLVARVFLNRLRQGMRLQSDPTTIYGVSGGMGRLDRALSHGDLERIDPYNTYQIAGLPAGPICNPGAASIAAAEHPASSDALYFVADGSGHHRFAATLAEHESNVAAYRADRRK